MDSNELREACEMAGLNVEERKGTVGGWRVLVPHPESDRPIDAFLYWRDNPALPAYVAELLTAKVRELPNSHLYGHYGALATTKQRIRAAMAVLKGGG